eukprot:509505_1
MKQMCKINIWQVHHWIIGLNGNKIENSPNLTRRYTDPKKLSLKWMKYELMRDWKRECIDANGVNFMNLRKKLTIEEIADNTIENGQLHVLVKMNGMRRCVLCGGISSWRCQGCTNRVKKDGFVVLCNAEKC